MWKRTDVRTEWLHLLKWMGGGAKKENMCARCSTHGHRDHSEACVAISTMLQPTGLAVNVRTYVALSTAKWLAGNGCVVVASGTTQELAWVAKQTGARKTRFANEMQCSAYARNEDV